MEKMNSNEVLKSFFRRERYIIKIQKNKFLLRFKDLGYCNFVNEKILYLIKLHKTTFLVYSNYFQYKLYFKCTKN